MRLPKPFVLVFICLSLLALVYSAGVSYVPNSACANSTGCDFFGPIWNITGFPGAGDSVNITSDVPIAIYANNANLALSYLTFGSTTLSAGVTFILVNSSLDIPGNGTRVSWYFHSTLQLYNSTLSAYGVSGAALNVETGVVRVQDLYCGPTTANNATFFGSTANIGNGYFSASGITFTSLTAAFLNSTDSTWDINDFYPEKIEISGGSVIVHDTMAVSFDTYSAVLLGVNASINTLLINTFDSHIDWYFNSSTVTATVKCSPGNCADYWQQFFICNSTVALSGTLEDTVVDCNIGQSTVTFFSGPSPTNVTVFSQNYQADFLTLTIEGEVMVTDWSPLFANVIVESGATLTFEDSLSTTGNVYGEGALVAKSNFYVHGNISIRELYFPQNWEAEIAFAEQVSISYLLSGPVFNLVPISFYVPSTIIGAPGLDLNNASLYCQGDYTQSGGYINFTFTQLLATNSSVITAGGIVHLVDVIIYVTIPASYSNVTKIVIARSQRSIFSQSIAFNVTYKGSTPFILVNSGEILALELSHPTLPPPTPTPTPAPSSGNSKIREFFDKNFWYIILSGSGVILIILLVVIGLVIRKRRSVNKYSRVLN